MASIHFVERKNNVTKVAGTTNEWESGYWVVGEETPRAWWARRARIHLYARTRWNGKS
jgi:hypothetical protein